MNEEEKMPYPWTLEERNHTSCRLLDANGQSVFTIDVHWKGDPTPLQIASRIVEATKDAALLGHIRKYAPVTPAILKQREYIERIGSQCK